MFVIGIDPGGSGSETAKTDQNGTGLVWLHDRQYLAGDMVHRLTGQSVPAYIEDIVARVEEWVTASASEELIVGVEGLSTPNPHMGTINVSGLLVAARVLGAVQLAFSPTIEIAPSGNGKRPLSSYPAEIVGDRETKSGGGWRNHLRSAFDVAEKAAAPSAAQRQLTPGGVR